jgi:hypothetical protein
MNLQDLGAIGDLVGAPIRDSAGGEGAPPT